jgi:hypothetical protein
MVFAQLARGWLMWSLRNQTYPLGAYGFWIPKIQAQFLPIGRMLPSPADRAGSKIGALPPFAVMMRKHRQ